MPKALALLLAFIVTTSGAAEKTIVDAKLHHLRKGAVAEWDEFSTPPEGEKLELKFNGLRNLKEQTLRLRQQDVKQTWFVSLNGKRLGELRIDENDMVLYFPIPTDVLKDGNNNITVTQDERSKVADDIRVGEIEIDSRTVETVLGEGSVRLIVNDADPGEPTPSRITVLSESGALQTVGAKSNQHLAVRPGIIYTSDGRAEFGLPVGRYTIFAGRGFEYSLAQQTVEVTAGKPADVTLQIRREVLTPGYVACDPHVHTLTHSGHGDSTIDERMITLAAEGIELPIATDHNIHIDYEPTAKKMQVRKYFTPVTGNEVTTSVGHFNVFPIAAGARVPNAKLNQWGPIFDEIFATSGVKAVILNHARDLHSGVRPFGPALHCALVGENLKGWQLRANAMEVVNSAATQTDSMRLFHDWMAMLNRGHLLTPVGASDSHDVGRHFVGQGRTYIRATDVDVSAIDVQQAVDNFVQGKVMVSYGLLAELFVEDTFRSGELAPQPGENIHFKVRVLAPSWIQADRVEIYSNGKKILEQQISSASDKQMGGVKWYGDLTIPRPRHDIHLVAIATGPGISGTYWKTAKPYQPRTTQWQARTIGCSGAVWVDCDGDGRRMPAREYADRVVRDVRDFAGLLEALKNYDEAVAAQAAYLWQKAGHSLTDPQVEQQLSNAPPAVRTGIITFLEAWRECERARVEAGQ
jgi:hypothetical protein